MRLLLRAGADPEAQTKGFARPLHVAASAGQMEAMRLLMVRSSNLSVDVSLGHT